MSNLIRLIYISRSAFQPVDNVEIEPSVARILAKSRANNRRNNLVGVLYFGNGCFFQCLEGPEEKVDALLETLKADDRHKDLKVLSRLQIRQLSFSKWDMKYVKLDQPISSFMAARGYTNFDPYALDSQATEELIKFLRIAPEPEAMVSQERMQPAPATLDKDSQRMLYISLLLSALSLVLSIGALFLASKA